MRILSIERTSLGNYILWISQGRFYRSLRVESDGRTRTLKKIPRRNYKDYETFANIFGKFNPDTKFLCDPIRVKDLKIPTLEQIQTG